MWGDTVHGGALYDDLTNGALRLHMYLSPGDTPDRHSVSITKRAGNAIITKAYGTKYTPPSVVPFLLDYYGKQWNSPFSSQVFIVLPAIKNCVYLVLLVY